MERGNDVVTISVASREEVTQRTLAAFRGEPQGSHLSFATWDLLWDTLAPKRLDIVHAMTGQGPMSIREAARRVGRDVKAVHGDIQKLVRNGIIDKTEDGRIVFPYNAIRVNFTVDKAA